MNIPSKYDPSTVEAKWYEYWMKNRFFRSTPDEREPYCIVIPPPNVTGVLHMGHMLNNTLQDVLVRRARMMGKNALWVPGTDHASIATEARVVNMLKEKGISKKDLTREEFLEYAWEWKEKHGGIILEQLKKLGASCDWERTCFTMDEVLSDSVVRVFVDLYNKGHIYRGVRMVNWDPQALTAVSDEEVIYREVRSKLYYVRYRVVEEDNYIIIATTRPETILGDTAVCVHPQDERFHAFKGKKVLVPLLDRPVPIIEDEYVDREFGTGALKITPAHDINDYELGIKHGLRSIDIFNDNGTLSEAAVLFVGEDRFRARELIVSELQNSGNLVRVEDYANKVGYSERTDAVIEPKLSIQWFLKMKKLAKPALDNVLNDTIKLRPAKFKNIYRYWIENVRDWCISRQLWWGHRIPAYYIGAHPGINDFVVADNAEVALKLAIEKTGNPALSAEDLHQDEDVLDTWFSSWLWPISVFDGIRHPDNDDINYYYPTNDLVTAPEILFFWVARMIMAGYEYRNEKPFNTVYLTGIVRDSKRRKMSKSLGNSPDPIDLITKYSADGVRVGMLLCSPAGNDLLFDESLTMQGRNFSNKIWNAFRLIRSWETDKGLAQPESSSVAIEWFGSQLNRTLIQIEDLFKKYRISDALMVVYKLFWDEFSSWYLEIIKPDRGKKMDEITFGRTIGFLERLLLALHPFMPFITEEIWQRIRQRRDGESIMISRMPEAERYDKQILEQFEQLKEIVANIRSIRKEKGIQNKEGIHLMMRSSTNGTYHSHLEPVLRKIINVVSVRPAEENMEKTISFIVKNVEYFIPLKGIVDENIEISKLENELSYTIGFLESVMKKLGNERFVQNAPAQVVEMEKRKRADAEAKIKVLKAQIRNLKGSF
ncbi:MAG: valine--tRNA ligase [Bacteroidales bacterium]|nr:valine--tRNA ligase [Bacteroidales bacterium]MBN2699143.1 valine--tRNA ligase [Bacteroidales bacterium]